MAIKLPWKILVATESYEENTHTACCLRYIPTTSPLRKSVYLLFEGMREMFTYEPKITFILFITLITFLTFILVTKGGCIFCCPDFDTKKI